MLANKAVVILHLRMPQKSSAFPRNISCDKIQCKLFLFSQKLVLVLMLRPVLL